MLLTLFLGACTSTPGPADPPRLKAALEAESDGAKRYGRGDYVVAVRRFDEAARIFTSIDDAPGSARNRLHQARTELALGRADAALQVLATAEGNGETALDALLIKAQAQLALGRDDAAQHSLALAATQCATACLQAASLNLLQARAALAGKRAADALKHGETALRLLHGKDEADETGNAWRIIAAARLALDDACLALPAARSALDIDRRLAAPEKIAHDWLLIGDILRKASQCRALPIGKSALSGSQEGTRPEARPLSEMAESTAAYQRALDVAKAAGLASVIRLATQALAETAKSK